MKKTIWIVLLCFVFSSTGEAKRFSSYSNYKDWLISNVAGANTNVWIKADKFDDYDLYCALIVAKSLKQIDVKVLLSGTIKDKAMIQDLKDAGIAIEKFNDSKPEDDFIRIDSKTYKLKGELNPYLNQKKFYAKKIKKSTANKMLAEFWKINDQKNPAASRQAYYYQPSRPSDYVPEGIPRSLPRKPIYLKNKRM